MKKSIYGLILIVLFSSSCSTSRQMQKEKHQESIDCTSVEKQIRHNDIVSHIKTQLSAVIEVTEKVDTNIKVKDPKTGMVIEVPVRFNRTTKRQEFTSTDQEIKDNSQINTQTNIHEKKAVRDESKEVKTKRPNLTLYIVIAASVLIVLLFVFLWRRFPLARMLDMFKCKSP